MTQKSQKFSFTLIFLVIIAVVAGFLGGIMSGSYTQESGPFFAGETTIKRAKNVQLKTIETSYEENKNLSQSIVGIYQAKKELKGYLSLDNIYNYSEAKGQGLVLTSDGWVLSLFDGFQSGKKYVAITQEGRIFQINDILKDSFTGVNFFKISEDINGVGVYDFNVFKLGDSDLLAAGEEIYLINRLNQVVYKRIKDVNWDNTSVLTGIVKDSGENSKFMLLSGGIGLSFYGSPVLNSEGEMIGVLKYDIETEEELIIPINNFERVIDSLLREKKITRPSLGLYYLELSQNYNLDSDIAHNLNKGTLLWNKGGRAIKLNGAAEAAELKEKDIILKVENEEINGDSDLASLIQYYDPGDKITLSVLRDGVIREASVVLGELE